MDIETTFAILMIVVAVGATALAAAHFTIARNELKHHRAMLNAWLAQFTDEADRRQLVIGKVQTALGDRVRALETYRVHHTDRLNELDDMMELLNQVEEYEDAYGTLDTDEGQRRVGLARGISRQTDFDDGVLHTDMQQHTEQLDAITRESVRIARKSVLDRSEQSALDIQDMDAVSDRPTYQGYVDSIAAELDANGNVRR